MSTEIEQLDASHMQDLVERITRTTRPLRIVLFGSAAQGKMGLDSDVDVMVVMPDGTHCLDTASHLYKQFFGFGFPVDILVATPKMLEQHKDNIGLIYRTVLAEGKEVYVA